MKLEDIWNEYRHHLRSFFLARVTEPQDADDLLQDVLIKTHRQLDKIDNIQNLKSWLFTIANHTLIDFYRANALSRDINDKVKWYESQSYTVGQELTICITPFLALLADEDAELLRRIDLQKESQKAVAEELGVNYSTFKSRLQSARNALKAQFDQCCAFDTDKDGNLIAYHPRQKGYPGEQLER